MHKIGYCSVILASNNSFHKKLNIYISLFSCLLCGSSLINIKFK